MKTFKVTGKMAMNGNMMLVQAENETQVIALFAFNWGLNNLDVDSIQVATTEDIVHYQSMRGKIHRADRHVLNRLLGILDAVPADESEPTPPPTAA